MLTVGRAFHFPYKLLAFTGHLACSPFPFKLRLSSYVLFLSTNGHKAHAYETPPNHW